MLQAIYKSKDHSWCKQLIIQHTKKTRHMTGLFGVFSNCLQKIELDHLITNSNTMTSRGNKKWLVDTGFEIEQSKNYRSHPYKSKTLIKKLKGILKKSQMNDGPKHPHCLLFAEEDCGLAPGVSLSVLDGSVISA